MIERPKILADCTVDKLASEIGGGGGWWKVTVWAALQPHLRAVYTIRARSDNVAALEGLRRFEDEHAGPPKLLVH